MNLSSIVNNKYFKYIKYLSVGAVILMAIVSLIAAWWAGGGQNRPDEPKDVTETIEGYRISCLVFGFLSIATAIITLANQKNPIVVIITTGLTILMLILLLTFASLAFTNTSYIPYIPPKPAT